MADIIEIETSEEMSREEAAARLRDLADELASNNEVAMRLNGKNVRVQVADRVRLEVEIEVGEEQSEIEIELTWRR